MEQKERELDDIELRSEKVRHIIGEVPPLIIRVGTVIITIAVVVLAVVFVGIISINKTQWK